MRTVPMPVVDLSPDWALLDREQSRLRVRLQVAGPRDQPVQVTLTRSLGTPLRDAYPASAHDIRVDIDATALDEVELSRLLREVVVAVETADPRCRRLVYPVPGTELSTMSAAEKAGFRFVVEVDVEDQEISLLVAEPDWVTRVDLDLERVPGS